MKSDALFRIDSDSTRTDLTGAGRVVGNTLSKGGDAITNLLAATGERVLGLGPTAAVVRFLRHFLVHVTPHLTCGHTLTTPTSLSLPPNCDNCSNSAHNLLIYLRTSKQPMCSQIVRCLLGISCPLCLSAIRLAMCDYPSSRGNVPGVVHSRQLLHRTCEKLATIIQTDAMIDNVVLAARYLNALVRLLGQECLLQDQSVCRLRVGIKDRIDSLDWIAATDPSIRESLNELRALLDVSHMLRLQQLTPEAMSRIIRHIDGNDEERAFSLCSMALACRALRRPAQAAIFKTLNIDNPRILDAVASAINGSPQLGSYVRELCLEIKHHTSGDWLEGLSRFSTRLSALYVVKIQGVSWTALGANAKQAILQTVTRAPALVLQSWKSFETQSMLDIMLACQNLESLAVRFCELRTCNVDQTKPNVETSLCPSLRHIELADNLRGANNLGHTLLSFTKLDSLTSVTVHLSSIMKQHIGGMVLHRLLTQVSCPKTYLHVSRVCDVCASGDSDSPWPTSQQFLTLLVPRALDEGENASTDLEDWFYDVLSVLYMPGTLWMQSTIVGTDEREAHLSTWQLRSHPRISSSPVPPGIRWFPPRALASYDEDEHLEERWRRAVVVRLSRLNAIPTYCVHRPAGDTVATAGSAREFTAS